MYETMYPTGHGVITVHKRNLQPSWSSSGDNPHKGLIKCIVEPPDKIAIPVLPMKIDDRLLFALCRTCAAKNRYGIKDENYDCIHNKNERSWVATVTHLELNAALNRGYKVPFLIRTLDYTTWSGDLFKPYIEQFIRLKIHASGWPAQIQTDMQKAKFVEEYKSKNIIIEPSKIEFNAGRRAIAKICNNR